MKKNFFPLIRKTQIWVISAALLAASSEAGIIEVLRGDSATPDPAVTSWNRTALVGSAVVRELSGTAEFLAGIDAWAKLTPGKRLQPGDMVRAISGAVVLQMEESKSLVRVPEGTLLRLAEFQQGWDPAALTGAEQRRGFVVRAVHGEAYLQSADGKWTPLTVNAVLSTGDVVRTARNGAVDFFATVEKKAFRLEGNTQLRLTREIAARRIIGQPALAAAIR